jgi:hypothetical protein
MLISVDTLATRIRETIARLKGSRLISMDTADAIVTLEDTLELVRETADNFSLDECPTSQEDCQALIAKDNDLCKFDVEGLHYLAQSVRQALDMVNETEASN